MMKQVPETTQVRPEQRLQTLRVEGMHCASCVSKIEKGLLERHPQLHEVSVNLAAGRVSVRGEIDRKTLTESVKSLGYEAFDPEDEPEHGGLSGSFTSFTRQKTAQKKLFLALVLSIPVFVMHMAGWHFVGSGWLQFILTSVVLFYCGSDIFGGALRSLRRLESDMDVLIAMGAGVAWLYSVLVLTFSERLGWGLDLYFETAAVIITLVLLGRFLEAKARRQTGDAMDSLLKQQPETAWVMEGQDFKECPVAFVQPGQEVLVRPGSRIPLDGEVLEGVSDVNESMMTGESVPVSKKAGDWVVGGTMNETGSLRIRVRRVGSETMLARITALIERAQTAKPPVQRMADQVAAVFVPTVLVLAMLTYIAWLLLGEPVSFALRNAIALLVISCPCALGLATPVAIQVALGRGARSGILIQDPIGLEKIFKLRNFVLDKTGTLTEGQPSVHVFHNASTHSDEDCLHWAAALESRSEHPFAKAILSYARKNNVDWRDADVQMFQSYTGEGISGTVDGKRVLIGKPAFLADQGIRDVVIAHQVGKSLEKGYTVVLMAVQEHLVGYFQIIDPLRPEAPELIRQLRKSGMHPVMLSGDRHETALAIGQQAGLLPEEIIANVPPQEKLERIRDFQAHGLVGMAGDGVNDAPALAQADFSIAMGSGTDVAMQTAQVTLLKGDFSRMMTVLNLGRAMTRIIRQNLFWAFFYNIIAIPIAALGFLNPVVAALAMTFSSLTVVLNSLRLKRIPL